MTLITIPTGKPFNGHLVTRLRLQHGYDVLQSNRPVVEECFAALDSKAEIERVGMDFIRGKGFKKNTKEVFLLFQAFIRQSKSFFESAESLHYRSSALLYYYSFLNLAKAYICLIEPRAVKTKIKHGLSHSLSTTDFQSQTVSVQRNGAQKQVFPLFYKYITGKPVVNNFEMNISEILGYCLDISHEYSISHYGYIKTLRAVYRIVFDANHGWPVMMIDNHSPLWKCKRALKKFSELFEEIRYSNSLVETFGIKQYEQFSYKFFQYKNTTIDKRIASQQAEEVYDAVRQLYSPNVYKDWWDFNLCMPLDISLVRPFNDTLAIYTTMFFLGSLVRYHPYYLEELYSSDSAWIIERFTKSCPETFLRQMTNLILDHDYIFTGR